MRQAIVFIFAAVLCASCFAQTTTAPDSQNLPSIPVIVAKKQFLNRVGSIKMFDLYTTNDDANFQLYVYVSSASCSGNGEVLGTRIYWTDDNAQFNAPFVSLNCTTQGGAYYNSGAVLIHAKAGTPIQMAIASDDVTTYGLSITLEHL